MNAPSSRLERVHALFAAAVSLDANRRAALLDDACINEPELRREVEELLAMDETPSKAGEITQGAGSDWLAADLAADNSPDQPPPPRIGRFAIVREIGRGGMGIVYEAQQDDPARRVALKVIHPGTIGRGLLRRFRQETRAMAQLRHPGIAQIYEAGTSIDGEGAVPRPYFVMELVEGPTLLKHAADAHLDVSARLELIARVCEALHHAHQKGVVHRDLKPDNILVQGADLTVPAGSHSGILPSSVQPKILDFGVSRLAEEHDTGSLHTLSGQIVGTIPYLSPEQAAGESAVADIRSDVYSMGVVAYQLLSGSLPFDTTDQSVRGATRIILEEPPRRLSSIAPALRGDIETIVHKAMDRDPERRYQSAADLAADIRRYVAHEPISARPPSAAYAVGKFVERNRSLTLVGAVSFVLIIGALIATSLLWADARRAREQALWQRYRSAMSAASFALEKGEIGIARRQLESTDPRFHGWEYRHFLSRLDQSTGVSRPRVPAPFMLVPSDDAAGPGLVFVEPVQTGTLVRASHEAAPLAPVDPRLLLWYTARASRATHQLTVSGPDLFTPDLETRNPVVHHITPWPYAPATHFDNPKLSDDGRTMVLFHRTPAASTLLLIDFASDHLRQVDLDRGGVPFRAAISGDGSRAAVATGFAQPRRLFAEVIDVPSGRVISTVSELPSEPHSLLLNRHGTRMFIAFHGGRMGAWDITTDPARLLAEQPYKFDAIENLTLNADETLLAGGNIEGVVRVFDASTLNNTISLIGHESEIHDVRFLPPPAAGLISAGRDGTVRRWSLSHPTEQPMVLRGHEHLVHALAIGPSGRFVATGSWDKTVRLFSLDDGRQIASIPAASFVQAMSLAPDERTLVTWEFNRDVRIFDIPSRSQIALIENRPSSLDQQLFDADSRRILFDFDPQARTATFYDIPSQHWATVSSEQIATVRGSTISNAAGIIARSESRERWFGTVLYDFRSGKEVLALRARRTANESIAFSPDGRTVVAPDEDHRIQAYEVPSGRHLGTFTGHTREVLAMTFSPDGSRLFSADYTGAIWIWDTHTREELAQLRGHTEHVRRLVMSSDGKLLISGSRDGTVRVWSD